jgi:hypothetical protein
MDFDKLREKWNVWNKNCHPEDRIDWGEYYEEHIAMESRIKEN